MDGCAGVRLRGSSGHIYSQQINEWSGIEKSIGMEKLSNTSILFSDQNGQIFETVLPVQEHNPQQTYHL